MAALRLWSGLRYNHHGVLMYDYTFWLPEVQIFSCLEVDFAIICASMPIFWPTVMAAWNQIHVTQEVIVTVENRHDADTRDVEMAETGSLKSHASTEGLMAGGGKQGRSFYIEDLPVPRIVKIQPIEDTVRMSWGGTALNK